MIKKNLYSIIVALLLLYLSLTNAEKFQKVQLIHIMYIDKLVHFGMYFVLMSVIILEHRKTLGNSINLFLLALIPLAYGILMEILQLTLTVSRSGDFYDALADAAGIFIAILLWLLVKPVIEKRIR